MEGPTQHMPPPPAPPPPGYGPGAPWQGGMRMPMPMPGNSEWMVWFVMEILFAIIWAASDQVGASLFVIVSAVLTLGYLISRGIAKAGKVVER